MQKYFRFILTALAALMIFIRLVVPLTPDPQGKDAPENRFSSARALADISEIARMPHPTGSAENDRVRDYIIARLKQSGMEVNVQETTSVRSWFSNFHTAAFVHNITARLRGTASTGALLIASHYDSVSTGPGANDDAAAAAAMLETIRALKIGPPLKNDVIFLFTDAEEPGLIGAEAFVRDHPWRNEVKAVFNFEARGKSGPSILFESGPRSARLISGFAKTAPHPYGNSLTNAMYDYMPNDTDFTVFREAGYPGLNFAYIDGVTAYHTVLDSPENVSERSLQHHGENMLALARRFGNERFDASDEKKYVYFNPIAGLMVYYPEPAAVVFAFIALAAFFAVAAYGARRGTLSIKKTAAGAGIVLALTVFVPLCVFVIWKGVSSLHGVYGSMIFGETYNSAYYRIAFSALALLGVMAALGFVKKQTGAKHLFAGALCVWGILTAASAVFLAGTSFMFLWPFAFALPVMFLCLRPLKNNIIQSALILLLSFPTILMMTDLTGQFFSGLTLRFAFVPVLVLVLYFAILIPLIDILQGDNRRAAASILAIVFIICMSAGSLTAGFSTEKPMPDTVLHAHDADSGKALWITCDEAADAWTSQFFKKDAVRREIPEFLPMADKCLFKPHVYLTSAAPSSGLKAPDLKVVSDTASESRDLRVRAVPGGDYPLMMIFIKSPAIRGIQINGEALQHIGASSLKPGMALISGLFNFRDWYVIQYHAVPAAGVDLALKTKPGAPVEIRLLSMRYGIPALPGMTIRPRPAEFMPAPEFLLKEGMLVNRKFML